MPPFLGILKRLRPNWFNLYAVLF